MGDSFPRPTLLGTGSRWCSAVTKPTHRKNFGVVVSGLNARISFMLYFPVSYALALALRHWADVRVWRKWNEARIARYQCFLFISLSP